MKRPIIFLDFDGVLNTEQYQARLAVDGKPNKDAWGPLFDPRAVDNLRMILDTTGASIVISSSWRYIHRLGSLRMMWEVRELPGEILDALPCGAEYISRGEDIECWLNQHGQPDYVIIERRTLLSIATPFSVKACGIYLEPPLPPFEVTICDLKHSSFVS